VLELAADDLRVILLSGDIGNRMYDDYKASYPTRFYNCGVAEANMTGVAAGLATCGLRPFIYTITPFATTRCLEQIRVDVGYHNLPVTIVAVGAGFSYGSLGTTHHACEDIAFLRAIPNMTVLCPGDAMEVAALTKAALLQSGPVYMRLGKKGEPVIHEQLDSVVIGKALKIREGEDVVLLSTGNILPEVMKLATLLEEEGVFAEVYSFHTVKPLDTDLLNELFEGRRLVAAFEEHSLIGGFSSAVSEWLVDSGRHRQGADFIRFGVRDEFVCRPGTQAYLRESFGLTANVLCQRILNRL